MERIPFGQARATLPFRPTSSQIEETSKSSYTLCDSEEKLASLVEHIDSLVTAHRSSSPQLSEFPHILLDCEGKDLGDIGGILGLVQIGVEDTTYLVDVVTLSSAITSLKPIFEDTALEKVVWDGRSDYSELLHGHQIGIENVLDLQLVQIQEYGRSGPQDVGFLTSMGKAFESLPYTSRMASGIDMRRREQGQKPRLS
jgi:hypothetical protein